MDEHRLAEIAVELARRVREDDIDDVGEWLLANTTEAERWALHFVQAAAGRTSAEQFWRATAWARRPPPPIVDEIAVERACRGEHVALTPHERHAVVEALVRRGGFSDGVIAQRAQLSRRHVLRIRNGEITQTPRRWVA